MCRDSRTHTLPDDLWRNEPGMVGVYLMSVVPLHPSCKHPTTRSRSLLEAGGSPRLCEEVIHRSTIAVMKSGEPPAELFFLHAVSKLNTLASKRRTKKKPLKTLLVVVVIHKGRFGKTHFMDYMTFYLLVFQTGSHLRKTPERRSQNKHCLLGVPKAQ
ncbi:hypothetical protein OAO01_00455 [Oligoflexia bacterium]|nr:hypothetical protein [Oligoflexia bacterium]